MPDLLTHYAAARVPALALRDPRLQALLVAGTFLPDVVAADSVQKFGRLRQGYGGQGPVAP